MLRPTLLLIFVAFLAACSSAPGTPVPTPDAVATETRIAANIFATQTASAPTASPATPTPAATSTPAPSATAAVSPTPAPSVTGTAGPLVSATCFALTEEDLPGFKRDSQLLLSDPAELEARGSELGFPVDWRPLMVNAGLTGACNTSFTTSSGPVTLVGLVAVFFETVDGAHTFYQGARVAELMQITSPAATPSEPVGQESQYFTVPASGGQAGGAVVFFRESNVVIFIGAQGTETESATEGLRVARLIQSQIDSPARGIESETPVLPPTVTAPGRTVTP